ncbi:MAG: 30S ribosomal protein S20, partial [Clostridia bacterium]
MPNIKSAKKRVLVSARQNAENVTKKTRVKNAIKKFNT